MNYFTLSQFTSSLNFLINTLIQSVNLILCSTSIRFVYLHRSMHSPQFCSILLLVLSRCCPSLHCLCCVHLCIHHHPIYRPIVLDVIWFLAHIMIQALAVSFSPVHRFLLRLTHIYLLISPHLPPFPPFSLILSFSPHSLLCLNVWLL